MKTGEVWYGIILYFPILLKPATSYLGKFSLPKIVFNYFLRRPGVLRPGLCKLGPRGGFWKPFFNGGKS